MVFCHYHEANIAVAFLSPNFVFDKFSYKVG